MKVFLLLLEGNICISRHSAKISMDITDQIVQKIQKFSEKRQEAEQESAKEPLSGTALHVYTRRLDATLQGLQEQVKRQQDELNKACYEILVIVEYLD